MKPTSGTLSWQTNAPAATTTSNTNQAQVTCSMSCQTQSAPVQTNTATTTMADAVIKPASTVVKSAPVPTPSNPVNELPETGTADTAIKFIGAGSLVAAGAAYASSRRELLRTVFKK